MAFEQNPTDPSPFDDPWTKSLLDLGRQYPSGTKFDVPSDQQLHMILPPTPSNWPAHTNRFAGSPGQMAAALGSGLPNPFSDVGKYTPQAPSSKPEPNKALDFWQHPSPKVIPIREGWMDVPLSHLQHMAGDVIPFPHPKDSYMDRDVLEAFNRHQPQGYLNKTSSFVDPKVRILPPGGQR